MTKKIFQLLTAALRWGDNEAWLSVRQNRTYKYKSLTLTKFQLISVTNPTLRAYNLHYMHDYIQFLKSVAWLAMLNLQVPWYDHLTASAQPWSIVFSSMLFPAGPSYQRSNLYCHGWSLAITCYAMASVREPSEGSRHFIENGCTSNGLSFCVPRKSFFHFWPLLHHQEQYK